MADQQEFHYFVQCHEAVQIVCAKAVLPCVENVVKDWHVTKQVELHTATTKTLITLQPCWSRCPTTVRGNTDRTQPSHCPINPIPCRNCIQWCHAIESLYWTNDKPQHEAPVTWANTSPPKLFHNHMEFAKAFSASIPPGQSLNTLGDFDHACLLQIMMNFGDCHRNDQANCDVIHKVYSVYNELCHKKTAGNLQLSLADRDSFLESIFDLTYLLEAIYPKYFSPMQASTVSMELQNLPVLPVTPEMEERARKPLTIDRKDGRKMDTRDDAVSDNSILQDTVVAGKEGVVDSITQQDEQQTVERKIDNGGKSTMITTPVSETDFRDITNALGPDELHHLVHNLGIKNHNIENAEKSADTTDPRLKTRAVLRWWRQTEGNKATREALFEAKQKIHNDRGLNEHPCQTDQAKMKLNETIQEWRLRLKKFYMVQKSEIRFGRSWFATADMDKLCVDLELVEDIETSRTSLTGDVMSFVRRVLGSMVRGYSLAGKLLLHGNAGAKKNSVKVESESTNCLTHQNLCNLSEHIFLFGSAGTGKTTLVTKIAYDWAKNVRIQSGSSGTDQLGSAHRMVLVFVLNIRYLNSNQSLAGAIKKQILPGVAEDDIDQVLQYIGHTGLVIFDGFDEMPKDLSNHALESPHLPCISVIFTSRSHMRDSFCMKYNKYAQVQVAGFSQQSVAIYISRFFSLIGKPVLASSLIQKVKESPLMQELSSFPVLLVMICLLWEDAHTQHTRNITFHSMTTLYGEAICKYLNKPFESKDQKCFPNLCVENVLQSLGKTSMIQLINRQIQIREDRFDPDALKAGIKMGLLIQSEGKLVNDNSVSFVHKTFQEYCAAFYLSRVFAVNFRIFQWYLNEMIGDEDIEEMENVLRFTCGLNIEAADVILSEILHRGEGPWNEKYMWNLIPVILVYEVELSHSLKLGDVNKLQSKLKSCAADKLDVCIVRHNLLPAFIYLTSDTRNLQRETWLSKITSFTCHHGFSNMASVIQVLNSMPLLHTAEVKVVGTWKTHYNETTKLTFDKLTQFTLSVTKEVHIASILMFLTGLPALERVMLGFGQLHFTYNELAAIKAIQLSLTLKFVDLIGDKLHTVSVGSLVCLLCRVPSLVKVSILNMHLDNNSKDNLMNLSKSLKELHISGLSLQEMPCFLNVKPLVWFLSCIPALTKLSLHRVKLVGEYDGDLVLSKELTHLTLSEEEPYILPQGMVSFVSFLSCLSELTHVSLINIQLTGELGGSCSVKITSVEEFRIVKTCLIASLGVVSANDSGTSGSDKKPFAFDSKRNYNTATADNSGGNDTGLVAPDSDDAGQYSYASYNTCDIGDGNISFDAQPPVDTCTSDKAAATLRAGSDDGLVVTDDICNGDTAASAFTDRTGNDRNLWRLVSRNIKIDVDIVDAADDHGIKASDNTRTDNTSPVAVGGDQHNLVAPDNTRTGVIADDDIDGNIVAVGKTHNSNTVANEFGESDQGLVASGNGTTTDDGSDGNDNSLAAHDSSTGNTAAPNGSNIGYCRAYPCSTYIMATLVIGVTAALLLSSNVVVALLVLLLVTAVTYSLNLIDSGNERTGNTNSAGGNAGWDNNDASGNIVDNSSTQSGKENDSKAANTFVAYSGGDDAIIGSGYACTSNTDAMACNSGRGNSIGVPGGTRTGNTATTAKSEVSNNRLGLLGCEQNILTKIIANLSTICSWSTEFEYHVWFEIFACAAPIISYLVSDRKKDLKHLITDCDLILSTLTNGEEDTLEHMLDSLLTVIAEETRVSPDAHVIFEQLVLVFEKLENASVSFRSGPASGRKVETNTVIVDEKIKVGLDMCYSSIGCHKDLIELLEIIDIMLSEFIAEICVKNTVWYGNDKIKMVLSTFCWPLIAEGKEMIETLNQTKKSIEYFQKAYEADAMLNVGLYLTQGIVSLMRTMPALKMVVLEDIHLNGFERGFNGNSVSTTESLSELWIQSSNQQMGFIVDATHLLKFLKHMPSVVRLCLHNIILTGDVGIEHVALSKSLNHFVMFGNTDKDCSVNLVELVKLLHCMPGLTTVELQSINLFPDLINTCSVVLDSVQHLIISSFPSGAVFKMSPTSILGFTRYMPGLAKLILEDIQLTEFDDERQSNYGINNTSVTECIIQSHASGYTFPGDINQLLKFLKYMPSVVRLCLYNIQLTSDVGIKCVALSKSLNHFDMFGNTDKDCSVNLVELVKLLHCMPGLTTVELQSINLIPDLIDTCFVVLDSVQHLIISSSGPVFKMSPTSILGFTRYMPGLAKLILEDIQLTEFDDERQSNYGINNTSVIECVIRSRAPGYTFHVDEKYLLKFLVHMPSVAKLVFMNVQLAGGLNGDEHVLLSESMKHFSMEGENGECFISVQTLVQLLQCMPGLTSAELSSINFSDQEIVDDTDLVLSDSLETIVMSSFVAGSAVKVNVARVLNLIGFMPGLSNMTFTDIQLTDFDDIAKVNFMRKNSSLMQFWIESSALDCVTNISVTHLLKFLTWLPFVVKVVVKNIQLTCDLVGKPMILSKSLKHFAMIGNTERDFQVNMAELVRLLQCMPGLNTVELQSIKLIPESSDTCHFLQDSVHNLRISSYPNGSVFKMSPTSILGFTGYMPGLTELILDDIQLTECCDERQSNYAKKNTSVTECWIRSCAPGYTFYVDENLLLKFLVYMPSVAKLGLSNVHLAGGVVGKPMILSKSLKEFVMIGDTERDFRVNMAELLRLLQCMPGLNTVQLLSIHLTPESSDACVVLQNPVHSLLISSVPSGSVFKMSPTSILGFTGYMPGLTKLILEDIQLTEFDDERQSNYGINNTSVIECVIRSRALGYTFHVDEKYLLKFLVHMPSVAKLVFMNVQLAGGLNGDEHVLLSESMKHFVMKGENGECFLSVKKLVKLLRCMPGLTRAELSSINLSNKEVLDNTDLMLSDSLKNFEMLSVVPGSVVNVNVARVLNLIGFMPGLSNMTFTDIQLTNFDDIAKVNFMTKNSSLMQFWIESSALDCVTNISVTHLLKFLKWLPSVVKVVVKNIQLTCDLVDKPMILSKSFKHFAMLGNRETDFQVNMAELVRLLQCMPGLNTVELQSIKLIPESSYTCHFLQDSVHYLRISSFPIGSVFKMSPTSIAGFMGNMPGLTKLTLEDIQLAEFDDERQSNSEIKKTSVTECWIKSRAPGYTFHVDEKYLLKLLVYMPSVAKLVLSDVHLAGDVVGKPMILSKSFKHFAMIGNTERDFHVNMNELLRLLQCMPGLNTVELQSINLIPESSDACPVIQHSVHTLLISSVLSGSVFKMSPTSILGFIGHMPGLTKLTLLDIQLTEFDDEHQSNSAIKNTSVTECVIQSCAPGYTFHIDEKYLLKLLVYMPSVAKLVLSDVHLAGDVDSKPMILSRSLKQFTMIGNTEKDFNVNIAELLRLLQCMPGLNTVELQSINLIPKSSNTCLDSVHNLLISSCPSGSVFKMSPTSILCFIGHMPGITRLILEDIQLIEFDDEHQSNSAVKNSIVTECVIRSRAPGYTFYVDEYHLLKFLVYMPSVAKLEFTNVQLAGGLEAHEPMMLSESMKHFVMRGENKHGSVTLLNVVNLLRCMPGLAKVELSSINLTGEVNNCHLISSSSLQVFEMSSTVKGSILAVSQAHILNLIRCMPRLKYVIFADIELTAGFQSDSQIPFIQVPSVTELWMLNRSTQNVCSINETNVLNILQCMPSLTTVGIKGYHLAGVLNRDSTTLSESLKQLFIVGGNVGQFVNLSSLTKLLRCMPELTYVELRSIDLVGELYDKNELLSESVKDFVMASYVPGKVLHVSVVHLMRLLHSMPGLRKVVLKDVQVTPKLYSNLVQISDSIEELWMSGGGNLNAFVITVTDLLRLLRCMPCLIRLRLQNVGLIGELNEYPMIWIESIKEFRMIGSDGDCPLHILVLVKLLRCMPNLDRVELRYMNLTGDIELVNDLLMSSFVPNKVINGHFICALNLNRRISGRVGLIFENVQVTCSTCKSPVNNFRPELL